MLRVICTFKGFFQGIICTLALVLQGLILMESGEITRTLHEKILRPAIKDDIVVIEKKERGRI